MSKQSGYRRYIRNIIRAHSPKTRRGARRRIRRSMRRYNRRRR